jgi:hypothetical protein
MKRSLLKFNANLRERPPDYTAFTSDMRRVKRQLEGVRNACGAYKGEASTQGGDIANHAVVERFLHGNLGAPVNLGAASSSALNHAPILDKETLRKNQRQCA